MTGSQGPQGFADYQRQEPWDSGTPIFSTHGAFTTTQQSAVLFMARYLRTVGYLSVSAGTILFEVQWFADQAGAQFIGNRTFLLTTVNNAGGVAQVSVPNLGPWARISLIPVSGAFTTNTTLFGSNRPPTTDFVVPDAALYTTSGLTVNPGASLLIGQGYLYAGPLQLSVNGGSNGVVVFYVMYDQTLTTIPLVQFTAPANEVTTQTLIAPPAPAAVQLSNADPVNPTTGVSVYAVPALTGAS